MGKDFSVIRMIILAALIMFLFDFIWTCASLPKIGFLIAWTVYCFFNVSYFLYKVWRDVNPKSKMKKKIQIKVLKHAIDNYYTELYTFGLCFRIYSSTKELTGNEAFTDSDLKKYIPTFTRENCTRLAEKYGFEKPHPTNMYWWDRFDKEPRLACLNALLQELEQK